MMEANNGMVLNHKPGMVPVSGLREHPDNPRLGGLKDIKKSIEENGFYGVVVVQKSTNMVLVGNHRFRAVKELGWEEIPAVFVDVDDERAKKIMLSDNRTSDIGQYDDQQLYELLKEFEDLTGTGYSKSDVDQLADLIDDLSFLADAEDTTLSSRDLASPSKESPNNVSELVPVSFNMTERQRDLVQSALTTAKSVYNLNDSSEALAIICEEWSA